MADSKWTDLWDLSNWSDEELTVLMSHVWPDLKAASNERVALTEESHIDGFSAGNTFPDLIGDIGTALSSYAEVIENSCFPESVMKTSDMVNSGTVTSTSDLPTEFGLQSLLTELGYTGIAHFQHYIDLDGGERPALARALWYVQWYKVMNYTTYLRRVLVKSGTIYSPYDFINEIQFNQYSLAVIYEYDTGTGAPIGITAKYRQPTYGATPIDLYVTNDLNETAPFSTPQEVRDYAISKMYTSSTWIDAGASGGRIFPIYARQLDQIRTDLPLSTSVGIYVTLYHSRLRFKTNQIFRSISPNKFVIPVWWLSYFTVAPYGSGGTFSDFGLGVSEDDRSFIEITADGSGWYNYYFDPDFDTEPVLTIPAVGNNITQNFSCVKTSLKPDMSLGVFESENNIYIEPNTTDGNNFQYYTPAP